MKRPYDLHGYSRAANRHSNEMKLTGQAAIAIAEANGLTLSKYADPIEDARTGLDPDEARKVASEDPNLIYIDVECAGWRQSGESIDAPQGINVADYFRLGDYLGPDQDGIEPAFYSAETARA